MLGGVTWAVRKRLWNSLTYLKLRLNEPLKVPVPQPLSRAVIPVPMRVQHPSIPIDTILVGDHPPDDEDDPKRRAFYAIQMWLAARFGPMQRGRPPVSADVEIALKRAYSKAFRRRLPAPVPAAALAGAVPDLGALSVRGPYASVTTREEDGTLCWDLRNLSDYEIHPGLIPIGCRVVFEAPTAAGEAPRAVRIDCDYGSVAPDDPQWDAAARLASCAVTTWTALVRHFGDIHLSFGAPAAMAVRARLPADHPLRRLLWPHVFGTQRSNHVVTIGQMTPLGEFPAMFSFTHEGMARIMADGHAAFDAGVLDPSADRERRGMADPGFDTPTEDNLAALFDVMSTHVRRYLDHYYPDDASVSADGAIQAWWRHLEEAVPNGLRLGAGPPDRQMLDRACARILYMATVYHDLCGTFLWGYQLNPASQPTQIPATGETVPEDVYQRLVMANAVLNVDRTPLLQDFGYLALDEAGRSAFRAFLEDLERMDASLTDAPEWILRPSMLEAHINA